jgi:hypothetical protein
MAGSLPQEFTVTLRNMAGNNVSGLYRALFCHTDSASLWPTAIKIRFNLADPDAPKEFDTGNSQTANAYDETVSYVVGNIVQYGGRTYRCIQINSNGAALPTNTAYWCLTGRYYEVICPISQ